MEKMSMLYCGLSALWSLYVLELFNVSILKLGAFQKHQYLHFCEPNSIVSFPSNLPRGIRPGGLLLQFSTFNIPFKVSRLSIQVRPLQSSGYFILTKL